ncbi:MAG: YkgJ family cysteine cluster protein [Bacteroidetes bacterium]|nr:YkgJ family cysteine cluster protein [Bacteroidota bacterium]
MQKFIKNLKRKKPKDLDQRFSEAHDEVFEELDCLTCANCCKTTSPMFFDKDIERLASHLKMKPAQFIETFLFLDTDGIYALKSSPCMFLGADNYCSVYEYRPKACREYPHTNQRKMINKLNLALKNTEICPAIEQILAKLEEYYK